MMKRLILIAASLLCTLPLLAQKMSKEERAALERQQYEAAVANIETKTFVIVPTAFISTDGEVTDNSSNDNFFSIEVDKAFSQGSEVCGNGNTNVAEITEYTQVVDKKGGIKLTIVVAGRMWKGTYRVSMRAGSNMADVIFNRPSGPTIKFQGPVVPLAGASFNKRSNPI